jgi:EAL domain-containing protein (putative c-di-GMP-specific phosphodiesterase class I)
VVQGYLVSRPLPDEAIAQFLTTTIQTPLIP